VIDFSELPDGTKLARSNNLDMQYKPFYGIKLSAFGGLQDHVLHLFDTSKVGNATFGDPDLGSPNKICPGGGMPLERMERIPSRIVITLETC
jgi:hypothetical protein